jgi:threonine/homoserine/homoserine lactone efflux protein
VESIFWLLVVSTVVDRTRRFLVQAGVRRWLDGVCGTLLVALGLRLALERR